MNKTAKEHTVNIYACKVTSVKPLNLTTFEVELQSLEDACLSYQAGQYLKLELDVNNDGQLHSLSYTIASRFNPEQPSCLRLIIQQRSEFSAKVLDRLHESLTNHFSVNITLAMGNGFLQTDVSLSHLLVAAGSGISKIKCITEEILQKNPEANLHIYWSNRSVDDFFLLGQFQNWARDYQNLHFTPLLESAAANWPGRSGYIYELIKEGFRDLAGVRAYFCGSPTMVYGTMDKLAPLGLEEQHCYSDVFEFAPRDKMIDV